MWCAISCIHSTEVLSMWCYQHSTEVLSMWCAISCIHSTEVLSMISLHSPRCYQWCAISCIHSTEVLSMWCAISCYIVHTHSTKVISYFAKPNWFKSQSGLFNKRIGNLLTPRNSFFNTGPRSFRVDFK